MPTPTKGPRLGGGPAHERLILANLATALFEHDRITTTEAKAKRVRPLAERLVTFAKRGDLHSRRKVMTIVRDNGVVHRLFTEIAPDMAERPGGYTRVVKITPRKGDNAPMAVIELVREPIATRQVVQQAEGATRRSARDAQAAVAPEPPAAPQAQEAQQSPVGESEADQAQAQIEQAEAARAQGASVVPPAQTLEINETITEDTTEAAMTRTEDADGTADDNGEGSETAGSDEVDGPDERA